jgi:hypothetical protein
MVAYHVFDLAGELLPCGGSREFSLSHHVLVKGVTTRDFLGGESIPKSRRVDDAMSSIVRAVNAYKVSLLRKHVLGIPLMSKTEI